MKLYFAPLEGITTRTYRTAHAEMFDGCDAYYAPFITPTDNEKLSLKTIRDIVPELNEGTNLKVQVLTNTSSSFEKFIDKISPLGYNEVNINLGCPSNTVCKKGRGSAFLKNPDELDRFLNDIFSCTDFKISLKTRLGFSSPEEFPRLLSVYKKYPLSLLIVHPRTREQLYRGQPDMESFSRAYAELEERLCYNGNINTLSEYSAVNRLYPKLHSVMIGRGAIANPAIFREIKGGKPLSTEELLCFTDKLIDKYIALFGNDVYTLHKLKEIWLYAITNYPEEKKIAKSLRKSTKLSEFRTLLGLLPELKQK